MSGLFLEKKLKELLAKKTISDKQALAFRIESKACLQKVVKMLLQKSPLQFVLIRNLSCIDPRKMQGKIVSKNKMKNVVNSLLEVNRIKENECDDIVRQFDEFMDEHSSSQEFFNFNPAIGRLDVLYYKRMHNVQKYCKLWEVCNMLLVLSHGQASVERGLSINRQIEIENMHYETYVAKRVICDHVNSAGGLANIAINKAMMLSVAGARQK